MNVRNQLIALSIKYSGDWYKIYHSLDSKDFFSEEEAEEMVKQISSGVITIIDEGFPDYLKQVRRPPFVLFYYGDISLIKSNRKNLGVVGTREPSERGIRVTEDIVQELNGDINIVSGLALGIDAIAHNQALKTRRKTIAVLGSGIDVCYPLTNIDTYELIKRRGLVISEYPGTTQPQKYFFTFRNRLVAALSRSVLITEAKRHSGTMTTVLWALESCRDVLCVPSSDLGNSACNLCIKDGAYLVENADDVNRFFIYP